LARGVVVDDDVLELDSGVGDAVVVVVLEVAASRAALAGVVAAASGVEVVVVEDVELDVEVEVVELVAGVSAVGFVEPGSAEPVAVPAAGTSLPVASPAVIAAATGFSPPGPTSTVNTERSVSFACVMRGRVAGQDGSAAAAAPVFVLTSVRQSGTLRTCRRSAKSPPN
jgi:hypothetical protein